MIRLVVGLGNPGSRYEGTRHNLGRLVVERLAGGQGEQFQQETGGPQAAVLGSFFPDGSPLRLARLACFMNESGPSLAGLLRLLRIPSEECLVVFDDFSIPFETLRVRRSGSDGGHNGMKSIIETLGTQAFPRLRLGIGPVPPGRDPADFVLERFRPEEVERLDVFIGRGVEALGAAARDLEKAMNGFNG